MKKRLLSILLALGMMLTFSLAAPAYAISTTANTYGLECTASFIPSGSEEPTTTSKTFYDSELSSILSALSTGKFTIGSTEYTLDPSKPYTIIIDGKKNNKNAISATIDKKVIITKDELSETSSDAYVIYNAQCVTIQAQNKTSKLEHSLTFSGGLEVQNGAMLSLKSSSTNERAILNYTFSKDLEVSGTLVMTGNVGGQQNINTAAFESGAALVINETGTATIAHVKLVGGSSESALIQNSGTLDIRAAGYHYCEIESSGTAIESNGGSVSMDAISISPSSEGNATAPLIVMNGGELTLNQSNYAGLTLTAPTNAPAIEITNGATATISAGTITSSTTGTSAVSVDGMSTIHLPINSEAVITATDTQAIDLAGGSTVKKGDLEITVGTAGAGYVNNDGEIILPAGSTVMENNQTTTLPNGGTVTKDETTGADKITPNAVPVESVTLSQTTLTLTTGDTAALTATVQPENATDKTVTWTSSNETIATVKDGEVTAISAGQAVITATAGGVEATCAVTVQAPYVPVPPVTPVQPVNPTPTPDPDPEPDPDPTPGEWNNPYADVAVNDWYYDAVAYVTAKGLMTGTTASTFAPNDTMTRAMVWTVLARMEGQSVEGGSPWYALAQSWAVSASVSNGTGPNDSITREQLVTMLYRQVGSPEVGVPELAKLGQFTDGEAVSDWAESAMAWAVANGILTGDGDLLNPQVRATRGQVAAILMRFCQQ